MTARALALFSGGLDSLLACRVIMEQGIEVRAVKFVTPFFGYELLEHSAGYCRDIRERYGIEVSLRDLSEPYLDMLLAPVYGYGRNFNPCVDCKILLLREARRMMSDIGADFLITGEVIGQRPMSQRRDTLRVIERDSGCDGLLLRPLCARHLPVTRAEESGLVDRQRLYGFGGRTRTPQIELAARFGIGEYPAPSGGCVLTDPNRAQRIRKFQEIRGRLPVEDARLLLLGRHFLLPGGAWLVLGRYSADNDLLERLRLPTDRMLMAVNRPGPLALLRYVAQQDDVALAAAAVLHFGKKVEGEPLEPVAVFSAAGREEVWASPCREMDFSRFRLCA
ncbi:MAG: thiamine biosynthesis protein [Thermodesulfobacteriota bacterium]